MVLRMVHRETPVQKRANYSSHKQLPWHSVAMRLWKRANNVTWVPAMGLWDRVVHRIAASPVGDPLLVRSSSHPRFRTARTKSLFFQVSTSIRSRVRSRQRSPGSRRVIPLLVKRAPLHWLPWLQEHPQDGRGCVAGADNHITTPVMVSR